MRKTGLDLCRLLACTAVVFSHTGMLFWDSDPASSAWAVYNLLCVIMHSSALLFFMVSGALFLDKERLDFKKHMRRTGHMIFLYYAWSLICNGVDTMFLHLWGLSWDGFFIRFLGGYFHLWFLPTLAMCYCALPLLHGLAHGDGDNVRRGTLLMSGLVCVLFTLTTIPDKPLWLQAALKPYEFLNFRYLIMMPLGWVLYQKRLGGRELALLGLAAAAAVLLIAEANRRYAIGLGYAVDVYYENLTLSSGLTAALVFCLCRRVETLSARLTQTLKTLSACSFGVYLSHPIVLDAVRSRHWDLTPYSALWLYPAFFALFMLLPFALSWLMLKLPGLRRLVS